MWSLKSLKDESCSYNLLVGTEYAVGRKNTQILLSDDPSISRRHSVLTVLHPNENLDDPEKVSILKLKDASSKYGTFKNEERLDKDQEVLLSENDIVKFGQFESKFKVCFSPLVVTTSCIHPSLKNDIKVIIHKLGGHIIPEWRPCCTHLIMSDVKVTVKALCCLVELKPIVTPQYLADLLKSCAKRSPVPNANDYVPPIGEPLLDKDKAVFSIVPERKSLFQEKTFIFLDDKQMKKLHLAVTAAGANAVLLKQEDQIDANLLIKSSSCVIQPFGDVMQDEKFVKFVKAITVALHRKKKRIIPESDFGLAVAYCSTEKFCNPDFDVGGAVFGTPKISSQTFTQEEVYVPDTDEQERKRRRELMGKLSAMDDIIASKKRKLVSDSQSVDTNGNRNDQRQSSGKNGPSTSNFKRIKTEVTSTPVAVVDISAEEKNISKSSSGSENYANAEPVEMCYDVDDDDDDDDDIQVIETVELPCLNAVPLSELSLKTSDKNTRLVADGDIETKISRPLTDISFSTVGNTMLANGFRCASKVNDTTVSENFEEELPRNLINIQVVDLVKRREPLSTNAVENQNGHVINYKKFKKVLHVGARGLPTIIGGSDLVPFTNNTEAMDNWLQENGEAESRETADDGGEFDWQSQRSRSRAR